MQNFVQCCAIHEQLENRCAIFFNIIIVQKNCATFCENKCNTGNVGNTKILLHNFVYIAQFCEQYWNVLVCSCVRRRLVTVTVTQTRDASLSGPSLRLSGRR